MIFVCDVGNTETTVAVIDGDVLRARGRFPTDTTRTAADCATLVAGLCADHGVVIADIVGAASGSVVPAATDALVEGIERALRIVPHRITAASPLGMRLDVEQPERVGADRIINTFAVWRRRAVDAIVIDLGTATTWDCVTADGRFLGGVIAPGVVTALTSLTGRTSQLADMPLEVPSRVIGRTTAECLRAGVMFGAADALEGIVRRIRAEWPTDAVPMVIATGGLARLVAPLCPSIDSVEPDLTLMGLAMAYRTVSGTGAG